jgi:hypothetical protein
MTASRTSMATVLGITVGTAVAIAAVAVFASTSNPTPKELFQQQYDKERAAAVVSPRAPKVDAQTVPGVSAKPKRTPGIVDVKQGPVRSSEFAVVNSWSGPVSAGGATWYVVWAGATASESTSPGLPGVIVDLQQPNADGFGFLDTIVGTFTDRNADGAFAIKGVNGTTLILSTPTGHVYNFDLQTHLFT